MCDEAMVDTYLHEADRHIHDAEDILRDLGSMGSTRIRRLRAATYLRAMRRLRGLIAGHRSLPWNQVAHAAPPIQIDPHRARHGSRRWRYPLRALAEHKFIDG